MEEGRLAGKVGGNVQQFLRDQFDYKRQSSMSRKSYRFIWLDNESKLKCNNQSSSEDSHTFFCLVNLNEISIIPTEHDLINICGQLPVIQHL